MKTNSQSPDDVKLLTLLRESRLAPELPADMREVILLCEWEDLSAAEAAAILDTTPKAIENRLYRARNLLRDRLRKWL